MGTQLGFSQVKDSEFASQAELNAAMSFGYISNPNAEVDTSGWSNSGANFTISRTTTSGEVLKGSASFELTANGSQAVNDYISTSFTLGLGDRNRLLKSRFYFKGTSNFDSGDCEFVFHDGTNEIIPSVTVIPGGDGIFEATWVSTSASSYTLRFKAKVTTAFSFVIDDVFVGYQDLVSSFAAGYVTTYSPTVNTGAYGTLERNTAVVWRRGKFAFINWELNQTGNGTAGSGPYWFSMPSGLQIDTNYIAEDISYLGTLGSGYVDSSGGPSTSPVNARAYDANNFYLTVVESAASNISSTSYSFSNTTLRISMQLVIPIVGWDETTVLQNSRVEYAYNSDTTNNNDTANYAQGRLGGLVPVVATTSKYKEVEFQYPTQEGESVQVWVKPKGRNWFNAACTRYSWHEYSSAIRGIDVQPVSGSLTKYRVYFAASGAGYSEEDAAANTWTTENSNGTRWVVVKSANPLAVESPNIVESMTFRWEETSGTDAGTPTADTWTITTLNTTDNPKGYSWGSVSSNVITLNAGSYRVTIFKENYAVGRSKTRLRNTTDSVTLINGHSGYHSGGSTDAGGTNVGSGYFVLTKPTTIELQYYYDGNIANGHGLAATSGIAEVYATVAIERYGAS